LREGVIRTWLLAIEESEWEKIEDQPFWPGQVEYISGVSHARFVAKISIEISNVILGESELCPDARIDLDTLIAGALLHDVGKLLEYSGPPNPKGERTQLGQNLTHMTLGAYLATKAGLPPMIAHCIEAHSETWPDPRRIFKRSYEAEIIKRADLLHVVALLNPHPENTTARRIIAYGEL
jgi:putative nucleotidyltransferase with HDIG domain